MFKAIGLALLAALALSAVAATGAQAETAGKFTAEELPAVATGHQEGATNRFTITTGAGETLRGVKCASATYEATLAAASASLTVTPHYTGCEDLSSNPVHVDLNGCDFEFTAGTYTKVPDEAHGTVHIKCPAEQSITITVLSPFNTNEVLCTIHVPPQENKATLTYTNKPISEGTPKPWVTVDANVTGIKYIETKNSIFCPLTNNHTTENGKFESSVKVKGYKDTGSHVGKTKADGTAVETDITTYTEGAEQGIHVR